MTNDVTADDLAAALRDANAVVVAIMTTTGLFNAYVENRRYVDVDEEQDRWQSLLDRYDAQRREKITPTIAACERAKRWDMSRARDESGDDRLWRVEQAREANWEIIRLRRQLRALGGDV